MILTAHLIHYHQLSKIFSNSFGFPFNKMIPPDEIILKSIFLFSKITSCLSSLYDIDKQGFFQLK